MPSTGRSPSTSPACGLLRSSRNRRHNKEDTQWVTGTYPKRPVSSS
jgi:hypothetical protein